MSRKLTKEFEPLDEIIEITDEGGIIEIVDDEDHY